MARTRSTEPASAAPGVDAAGRDALAAVIAGSVHHGLRHGAPLPVHTAEFPPTLQRHRASFVTLYDAGELCGCIGSLEAQRALVEDVAANAYGAAFRDPRFEPLQAERLRALAATVSVLSPARALDVACEHELLETLRPGQDGLIVALGERRATFLPAVWASLPEPRDFLRALKHKAGLDPDTWPDGLEVSRYETETIGIDDLTPYLPVD